MEDEFDDGWDVAELIVESPSGVKRSYKTDCDSVNPLVHRYCPLFNDEVESKGIHKMYIVNGKEAKFNWEILWRVYDESTATWLIGDVNTEMDFEWQYHGSSFLNTRVHKLRQNLTCTVCAANEEEWEAHERSHHKSKPKSKALQNLRALHSRQETSTPTVSPAPTIVTDSSKEWNKFEMINAVAGGITDSWFNADGHGTFFYISDPQGKKLIHSGSACGAGNVAVSCFLKLEDGEYTLRVTGANDLHRLQRRWKFCQGLNYQTSQTELYFSIVDGVCFPVMTRHQTLVCNNVLKVTHLQVEIGLTGDFTNLVGYEKSISVGQLEPISLATSTALQQLLGYEEYSSSVVRIDQASANSILVVIDVGFKHLNENMYSTLQGLEFGDVGASSRLKIQNAVLSTAVSSATHDSAVVDSLTGVTVHSISIADESVDENSQDESKFQQVTDFIPEISKVQSNPDAMMLNAEHVVSIAGYLMTVATILVAIGFVFTKIQKRISPAVQLQASPIKQSAARSSLHRVDLSSDDDSEGDDEEDIEVNSSRSVTRKLSSLERSKSKSKSKPLREGDVPSSSSLLSSKKTKSSQDRMKLKKLLEGESAVYRKAEKAGVR